MRAALSLLLGGLLIAACGPGGPGTTSRPSFSIPSMPPVELPSGLALPTLVGGQSPACQLVTEAEMSALVGEPMAVSAFAGPECTWSARDFSPTVVVRYDTGETIESAKAIFTAGARDLTIGGNRAYFASAPSTLLYIDKGGRTLVIQAIWNLEGDAEVQKVSEIGELAIPRF